MIKMSKMSISKNALNDRLRKKTLSLSEKVQLLDSRGKNLKIGCRVISEIFKIGKVSAAMIIKNEEKLHKECASVQGNRKRNRQGTLSISMKEFICGTQKVVQSICIPQVLLYKKKHWR